MNSFGRGSKRIAVISLSGPPHSTTRTSSLARALETAEQDAEETQFGSHVFEAATEENR
jgi:hypothetical protein